MALIRKTGKCEKDSQDCSIVDSLWCKRERETLSGFQELVNITYVHQKADNIAWNNTYRIMHISVRKIVCKVCTLGKVY